MSSQWLILPSRLHSCLPAGSCPPCRPFMTAPSNHHPADDAERISSICGACMIDRRRHHAHAAAAHGPLRARRAGGRRLSRMRHWKGHVPCSAVGAGECGGWHTTTARAVCARRRSQESAARRLSLHGPCWGSGGLVQGPALAVGQVNWPLKRNSPTPSALRRRAWLWGHLTSKAKSQGQE